MAYSKGNGGSLTSGKGLCSYSKNPMSAAKQVSPMAGPGLNPDQKKANRLLQEAQRKVDSLRGMSGM